MSRAEPPFTEIVYGRAVRVTDLVRRVTQHNPGPFSGPGTNTHLIGRQQLVILDPGEDTDEHFEAVTGAVGEAQVKAIIPTHSHPDHWPLAPRLGRRFGAPVLAFRAVDDFRPDATLSDGERVETVDAALVAIHTPGHASDHLSFLLEPEDVLFSGDHVMGWSTTIISPPDGNLNDYLHSLDRLIELARQRPLSLMVPAHGLPLEDGLGRCEELKQHRLERTEQALSAMAAGLDTIPAMVKRIYTDVDPRMHPAAERSLLAHLLALEEAGRVESTGEDPVTTRYRLVS